MNFLERPDKSNPDKIVRVPMLKDYCVFNDTEKLDAWLDDARDSGIHCLRQFAIKARQDLTAVQNAVTERWSNGQTEGQINKLKILKRAMYGRAGVDLLRARMAALRTTHIHTN